MPKHYISREDKDDSYLLQEIEEDNSNFWRYHERFSVFDWKQTKIDYSKRAEEEKERSEKSLKIIENNIKAV